MFSAGDIGTKEREEAYKKQMDGTVYSFMHLYKMVTQVGKLRQAVGRSIWQLEFNIKM